MSKYITAFGASYGAVNKSFIIYLFDRMSVNRLVEYYLYRRLFRYKNLRFCFYCEVQENILFFVKKTVVLVIMVTLKSIELYFAVFVRLIMQMKTKNKNEKHHRYVWIL